MEPFEFIQTSSGFQEKTSESNLIPNISTGNRFITTTEAYPAANSTIISTATSTEEYPATFFIKPAEETVQKTPVICEEVRPVKTRQYKTITRYKPVTKTTYEKRVVTKYVLVPITIMVPAHLVNQVNQVPFRVTSATVSKLVSPRAFPSPQPFQRQVQPTYPMMNIEPHFQPVPVPRPVISNPSIVPKVSQNAHFVRNYNIWDGRKTPIVYPFPTARARGLTNALSGINLTLPNVNTPLRAVNNKLSFSPSGVNDTLPSHNAGIYNLGNGSTNNLASEINNLTNGARCSDNLSSGVNNIGAGLTDNFAYDTNNLGNNLTNKLNSGVNNLTNGSSNLDNISKKELISVVFKISNESFFYPNGWTINYKNYGFPIACYNVDDFSIIEEKLLNNFPDLKEEKLIFKLNDNVINKSFNLIRNNIKDNSIILINIIEQNMIKIYFISDEPKINHLINCYDSNIFSTIENQFYNVFPQLKEKNVIFQVDGHKVDKSLSLEENNIKNNAIINMLISDSEKIIVTFNSIDPAINWSLACNDSDVFETIEKKLYNKFPELKKEYYFFANGDVIEKSKTLKQNKINNETIILFRAMDEEGINERDKLIAVIFNTIDKTINYSMPCYTHDIFSKVENKLYERFPKLKRKNLDFNANEKIINKNMTLEQNNIKIGTNILIIDKSQNNMITMEEIIAVMLASADGNINISFACKIHDKFSTLKQKLLHEYPELSSKTIEFLHDGSVVDESKTLKENKIKNGSIILFVNIDY